MPSNRRPLLREKRAHISAVALQAFEDGDETALHRALGLRPWVESPLDAGLDGEMPSYVRADQWDEPKRLRGLLKAASAARQRDAV